MPKTIRPAPRRPGLPGPAARRGRRLLAVAAVLLLSACGQPAAPPPAPVPTPPPPKPVAARPPLPSLAKADPLIWHFDVSGATCHASASAPGIDLGIGLGGGANGGTGAGESKFLTTLAGPRVRNTAHAGPVQTAFDGPAGGWNAPVRWQAAQITIETAANERGLASMLALLGGGSLRLSAGRRTIGTLEIAASGPDGRAWLACIRHSLTASAD